MARPRNDDFGLRYSHRGSPTPRTPLRTVTPVAGTIPAARSVARSRARLGTTLLGYMVGLTLIVTLLPFEFRWPEQWRVLQSATAFDFYANIVLFVPLGFLFRLAAPAGGRLTALAALGGGALLSAGIETAQLFEVARYAAVPDVVANAAGAGLGAVACGIVGRRLTAPQEVIGRLSLELPLMGLVYLMVPLLWLNSLVGGDGHVHGLLSVLLAVFGASVVSGVQQHHLGPRRGVAAATTAVAYMLWLAAGAFPLARDNALILVLAMAVGAGLILVRGRRGHPVSPAAGRRYEVPVLLGAAPAYAAYLLLLCVVPWLEGLGPWHGRLGIAAWSGADGRRSILALLELVAACTLAGYMCAEYRGRALTTFRHRLRYSLTIGAVSALLVESLHGFAVARGASLVRGLLLFGASLLGARLYDLQRAHVLALLEVPRAVEPAGPPVRPSAA